MKDLCNYLNIVFDPQMLDSEEVSTMMGNVNIHDHHVRVSSKISSQLIGVGRDLQAYEIKTSFGEILEKELKKRGYSPFIKD